MSLQSITETEKKFLNGEFRALGRLISQAENGDETLFSFLATHAGRRGRSCRIGISGAPGAGKSSLMGELIRRFRRDGKTVAAIAVDPVSPFSGGAILGDRIRLTEFFNDEGVFIRSLSTRGKLGGVSVASHQVADLCDVFGFDVILIETVGVGQSEVDIRDLVDEVVVVLVPEWGDSIQAIKAGILEVGDLFVVNKADREGADRVVLELTAMLAFSTERGAKVLKTSLQDLESLDAFYDAANAWLKNEESRWQEKRRLRVGRIVEGWIRESLWREFLRQHSFDSGEVVDAYETYTKFRSGVE